MEVINAIIICVVIALVLTPVIICAFPICTIMELIFFICELRGDKEFCHNLWPDFISRCADFIVESFRKMMNYK